MKNIITILFLLLFQIANAQVQSLTSGNWNNESTWVGGIIPNSSTTDIEIVSNHIITITSDVIVRNIIINKGNINIGSNKLTIYGTITGTESNNVNSNSNTELAILENTNTPIFEFPTNIEKLKKLTINRKAGASSNHSLDLDDGVPADGKVLVLTNGVIYMNNGSILYLNSKSIEADIACSDSSHVDGIVQRNIPKNSGIYTFPVGNKGICRPFGVGLQNGNSDNINQIQFLYEPPINNENIDYNNLPGGIIQYFYWKHTIISGGNPQRRLSYSDSDFPNITSEQRINSMTLANTNGTAKWDKATTGYSVHDDKKWIEFDNANASNSEFWTLGSILGDVSYEDIYMPIELLFFSADIKINGILLEWETASEINNEEFTIQHSQNGIEFQDIATIAGSGTTTSSEYYSFLDENPLQNTSYYQLKQRDYNGDYSLSKIISIENKYDKIYFKLNPIDYGIWQCQIKGNVSNEAKITVLDMKGKEIVSFKSPIISENGNLSTINLLPYIKNNTILILLIEIDSNHFQQKIYLQN